jgi:hypothetical protein
MKLNNLFIMSKVIKQDKLMKLEGIMESLEYLAKRSLLNPK